MKVKRDGKLKIENGERNLIFMNSYLHTGIYNKIKLRICEEENL